jgi:hypothetical protein
MNPEVRHGATSGYARVYARGGEADLSTRSDGGASRAGFGGAGHGVTPADSPQAFPGQGQMKPEQAELARLRREVIKLESLSPMEFEMQA